MKIRLIRLRRQLLIHLSQNIGENPPHAVGRHQAEPHLAGDQHGQPASLPQAGQQPVDFLLNMGLDFLHAGPGERLVLRLLVQHEIGHHVGHAVQQHVALGMGAQHLVQGGAGLRRHPMGGPPAPVCLNAPGHFSVQAAGGGDVQHRGAAGEKPLRLGALAAAHAAGQQYQMGQPILSFSGLHAFYYTESWKECP